ncbi:MAG: VIT1/CCC1 transporter family protein [Candidatus Methanomethylicia archaeon]|nr:VIT1/CCC1 transporter family protein [Candidatus Methanomethylicia archaeon]
MVVVKNIRAYENLILYAQRGEITEYMIYSKLSNYVDGQNRDILIKIANDELKHYELLKKYSGIDVKPNLIKFFWYILVSRVFGFTFGLKLMENGEKTAVKVYSLLSKSIPEIYEVLKDEEIHEIRLIDLLDEEKLRYVGSMVLGLNDALVELTGALAGFTIALQDSKLISLLGFITGVAASFSMAASEYLSTKAEGEVKNPLKASIYTGLMYILTVLFLIFPYIFISNAYLCLLLTIVEVIIIIFIFTFYISVAKELPFRKRFLEMLIISLGVASISFALGFFIKIIFNIEV